MTNLTRRLTCRLALSFLAFCLVSGCLTRHPNETIEDYFPNQSPYQNQQPKVPQGTTTSGGGILYGFKANPWFKPGQVNPTWCLNLDSTVFSLSGAEVEVILQSVIRAWEPVGHVKFEQVSCRNEADVRFEFGTLSEQDPHAAAITVMTDYNESLQWGRGFIYVSPDQGPKVPVGSPVIERAWSRLDGALLKLTLLHELGHVFGLQHIQESDGLMGARTIEFMLNPNLVISAESDPVKKDQFRDRMFEFSPLSMIDFQSLNQYERCDDKSCTRVVLRYEENDLLYLEFWSAPKAVRFFWSDAGFELKGTAELRGVKTELKAISHIFDGKDYHPGIIARKTYFTGQYKTLQSEKSYRMTVNWSAGNAPQVHIIEENEIKILFE